MKQMAATACPQGLLTTLVVVLQWKSREKTTRGCRNECLNHNWARVNGVQLSTLSVSTL